MDTKSEVVKKVAEGLGIPVTDIKVFNIDEERHEKLSLEEVMRRHYPTILAIVLKYHRDEMNGRAI